MTQNPIFYKLRKIIILAVADLAAFMLSGFGVEIFLGRAEWPHIFVWGALNAVLIGTLFALFGLYTLPIRSAGLTEVSNILLVMAVDLLFNIFFALFTGWVTILQVVLFSLFFLNLSVLSRFSYRIFWAVRFRVQARSGYERVMVVGGGDAGAMVIREMKTSDKLKLLPVCVIDDNPALNHTRVCGVPVVGNRFDIERVAAAYRITRIFVAMPAAPRKDVSAISEICLRKTSCHVQILPGMYQMLNGSVSLSMLRDVDVEDVLGREAVKINAEEVCQYIENKVVLVTGGGGSIGSELCRQIATHHPKKLVVFDIYENNAYDLEMELRHNFPDLPLKIVIGSVRDEKRVNSVFAAEKPQIIFHAAAHKHVPLMENSPHEAIKNNVFGTLNVAKAANDYGAQRFVMISTDKAVNPTNIMGASKRICEMIVQTFGRHSAHTEYVAVRFGNVLGSNGSVIPLFKKQIKAGGPVTVTHPDIIRYFMTIPEAVSLVLQAGAYAKDGQIFVLNMGEPVKILTLAENLIRLSGYEPYRDIDITFTGLRPGEKLFEELLMNEEGLQNTANEMIRVGCPIQFDEEVLFASLKEFRELMMDDTADLVPIIKRLVPTYHQPDGAHAPQKAISKESV